MLTTLLSFGVPMLLGGDEMGRIQQANNNALAIALYPDGSDDPDRAEDGTWLLDDDFLVLATTSPSTPVHHGAVRSPSRLNAPAQRPACTAPYLDFPSNRGGDRAGRWLSG
jgi:hypothetical protein